MIEIGELQNDFAAGCPSVSFAHMSGLHAAVIHKIDLSQKSGLEKRVGTNQDPAGASRGFLEQTTFTSLILISSPQVKEKPVFSLSIHVSRP